MAKSITIHNLDDRLSMRLEEKARREGRSLNKTIKMVLEEAIEPKAGGAAARRDMFAEFLGVWKRSELDRFQAATAGLRQIDEDDWR